MLYLSLINTTTAVEVNDDFTMLWILLSGILVFFMQAGFTLVESGFTRSKNAVNISMKNILDISVGTLSYWFIGYGLMYGSSNGWIATSDIFFNPGQRHSTVCRLYAPGAWCMHACACMRACVCLWWQRSWPNGSHADHRGRVRIIDCPVACQCLPVQPVQPSALGARSPTTIVT